MYKAFRSKINDVDDQGVVSIYVNGFNNKDSDGDISDPKSFNKVISDGFPRIKHLKDHNRFQFLGVPLEMKSDTRGLLVRSAMNIKNTLPRETFEDYKFCAMHDTTLEHSIGYDIVKSHYDKARNAKVITEYKLYEYSTLSFLGANENTPLVDFKDSVKIGELLTLLRSMLSGRYSDEKFKQIESMISKIESLVKGEPAAATPKGEPLEIINIFKNNFKI